MKSLVHVLDFSKGVFKIWRLKIGTICVLECRNLSLVDNPFSQDKNLRTVSLSFLRMSKMLIQDDSCVNELTFMYESINIWQIKKEDKLTDFEASKCKNTS